MTDSCYFSVVTVTLNSAQTLRDTLDSVAFQEGVEVEHIVKDGGSRDDTLTIVRSHTGHVHLIERQDIGIYDAMNQGFEETTGEVVCFLNSDDYFSDPFVLQDVKAAFVNSNADIVYGDLDIINENGRIVRHWRSGEISNGQLKGQQLPHPCFFVRRSLLEKLSPPFDQSFRISADFKQQLVLINMMGAKSYYIPRTLVRMRHGGESSRSLKAIAKGWQECMRAYQEVTGKSGWIFVFMKVVRKLPQFSTVRRK